MYLIKILRKTILMSMISIVAYGAQADEAGAKKACYWLAGASPEVCSLDKLEVQLFKVAYLKNQDETLRRQLALADANLLNCKDRFVEACTSASKKDEGND